MVLTGIRAIANRGAPSTWVLAGVLCVQLFLWPHVGVNPLSRLAGMAAFCRSASLEITEYVRDERAAWTIDWARTPDGRTYSNKAPGGVVVGIPVYCAIQKVFGAGESVQSQFQIRYIANFVLSLIFQILPLGFLILRLRDHCRAREGERIALVLALGLGNTAALMMNAWFGHGLVAVLSLGVLLSILERRPLLAGLCAGFAVAMDYSALLALPALLMVGRSWDWRKVVLGLLPGLAFIGSIHFALFGSPWILVQKFQNPAFVDVPTGTALFGVFHSFPQFEAIWGLVFGLERGLLWTQPIVFFGLVWGLFRLGSNPERAAWRFSLAYFVLLFMMNASFGAWHAGGSPGARYLCGALPLLAFFGVRALVFAAARVGVIIALALSVTFGVLVLITTQTPGRGAIWPELLQMITNDPGVRLLRLVVVLGVLGVSGLNAARIMRRSFLSLKTEPR